MVHQSDSLLSSSLFKHVFILLVFYDQCVRFPFFSHIIYLFVHEQLIFPISVVTMLRLAIVCKMETR